MTTRKEDSQDKKSWFRSERFFNEGNRWFFTTREGTIEGPYESRAEAEQELMMYLRNLRERENFGIKPGNEQS